MSDVERDAWRAWVAAIGSVAPVGPALRDALAKKTWRFHSGDSFRTPTSAEELREAAHRHRTVSLRMLGQSSRCVVFRTSWNDPPPSERWVPASIPSLFVRADWLAEWLVGSRTDVVELFNDEDLLSQIVMPVVAGQSGARITALSTESGVVYCPYDGGADVVMKSVSDANDARMEFLRWSVTY